MKGGPPVLIRIIPSDLEVSLSKIAIEIDSKWVKIIRSPAYFVVLALQGLSISFAPLFLYWIGKGQFFPGLEWITLPLSYGVMFIVFLFYMLLGARSSSS
jgi:hypothetical protein